MKVGLPHTMLWITGLLSFPSTLQILPSLSAQAILPFVFSVLRGLSMASWPSGHSSQLKCWFSDPDYCFPPHPSCPFMQFIYFTAHLTLFAYLHTVWLPTA